jgi:hypothetical protein
VDTVQVARSSGTVALIRPDAYIAWAQKAQGTGGPAGTGDRAPQLRHALARWCGSQAPAG